MLTVVAWMVVSSAHADAGFSCGANYRDQQAGNLPNRCLDREEGEPCGYVGVCDANHQCVVVSEPENTGDTGTEASVGLGVALAGGILLAARRRR